MIFRNLPCETRAGGICARDPIKCPGGKNTNIKKTKKRVVCIIKTLITSLKFYFTQFIH